MTANPLAPVLADMVRDLADARQEIAALRLLGAARLDYLNWLTTQAATAVARGWQRGNDEPQRPGDWGAMLQRARVDLIAEWGRELDRREHQRDTMRADRGVAA